MTTEAGVRARPWLGEELLRTLQLVTETIVGSLGFEVATINLVVPDEDVAVVAAVSGPQEVREALLHHRQGLSGWHTLLEQSEPWGTLRFLDHVLHPVEPDDVYSWVPDTPVLDVPDAWHPEDALFAVLRSGTGALLGMLSVDVPVDGRRPSETTRHALEAFAVMAALALEHAQLAETSRRGLRRFQAVFDASAVPAALLGPDGRLTSVNDAYCRFLGRSRELLVGQDPSDYMHPDDVSLPLPVAGSGPSSATVERRYLRPDGAVVWGRLHLAPLGSDDEPDVLVAQVEDVTVRKHTEQRLVQQAHYDALTQLPNRTYVMSHLRAALTGDSGISAMTAVFFCDLDRLKLVNDAHGHAVGDAYLREVGERIRAAVRDKDVVGRLGGDEFVVVCPSISTPTEAVGLAGRVIERVRQPFHVAGVELKPSVSLGISFCTPGSETTAEELLAHADAAMYRAKGEGRGSWSVWDPTTRNTAVEQLRLRSDVPLALERGEFRLHYQPIVRLGGGRVVGYEALLRWQHPRKGLLAPGQFLDVVLDSEYETPVTDWALREACRQTAHQFGPARRVSVNVSSVQVGRRDLPEVVEKALHDAGLPARSLVLELTEDRLLSRADGAALLADLRATGVSLALDDFGTGYAGLNYLQRFPSLDVVKLDRTFVRDLGTAPVSEHIVRSVVALARDCGLRLITEGVETAAQARLLAELGVDFAQGYHFGRPAPLALPAGEPDDAAG